MSEFSDDDVIAIFFEKEDTGKKLALTKIKYQWVLQIAKNKYTIELHDSRVSGKKKVLLNGKDQHDEIQLRFWMFNYSWPLNNKLLSITWSSNNSQFDLTINGVSFHRYKDNTGRRQQRLHSHEQENTDSRRSSQNEPAKSEENPSNQLDNILSSKIACAQPNVCEVDLLDLDGPSVGSSDVMPPKPSPNLTHVFEVAQQDNNSPQLYPQQTLPDPVADVPLVDVTGYTPVVPAGSPYPQLDGKVKMGGDYVPSNMSDPLSELHLSTGNENCNMQSSQSTQYIQQQLIAAQMYQDGLYQDKLFQQQNDPFDYPSQQNAYTLQENYDNMGHHNVPMSSPPAVGGTNYSMDVNCRDNFDFVKEDNQLWPNAHELNYTPQKENYNRESFNKEIVNNSETPAFKNSSPRTTEEEFWQSCVVNLDTLKSKTDQSETAKNAASTQQ